MRNNGLLLSQNFPNNAEFRITEGPLDITIIHFSKTTNRYK
jgi:hypothetical protein